MDVQQLEYQAPLLESPRARPGKPPVAPEADLARGDRDWSLIDALRQREPIAAERLVATYGDHAYRLAIGITGNAQDAEEVVQDAFWSVLRKIDTFRGESAFASWLYRIVANGACQNLRRRRYQRLEITLDEVLPDSPCVDWSAR